MNKPSSSRFCIVVAISVAMAGLINNARAALNYWDPGGATVLSTSTETWEHAKWAPTSTPTASTVNWTEGVAAAFSASAGNATNGTYTVTANANHTIAGIFNGDISDMLSTNLQIKGTGILTIAAGDQGFDTRGGGNTTIYSVLGGSGRPQTQGTGSLFFYGTNTFTGGIQLNTGAGLNFNNNSSFGAGAITNMATATVLATPLTDGGGNATGATNALTIANDIWIFNNIAVANNSQITFVGNASAPVTWTGNWHMNAPNTNTFTLDSRSGTLTISGVISGAENITKNNTTGTLVLNGANTFSGKFQINGPVSVGSLNKVSGGTANSNLGHPTTAANGTIGIGSTSTAGTLIYTGAGETSDRIIDLSGTTGGATVQTENTGNLILTAVNTASGAGAKTLTLTGSGATTNSIGKIVDNSTPANPTSVSKTGTTTWTLSAANTYSGTTSVTAGKLQLGNAASLGTNTLTWSSGSIDNTTGSDLTLHNNITVGGNPTYLGSANDLTFTGTTTLSGNRTITVSANTLTLGIVAETTGGSRNLAKSGNGTLALTGVCTYTGTTTVNTGGTLQLTGAAQLESGNCTNTVTATGTFDYSSSAAQTLAGVVAGAGTISVDGSGAVTLSGSANTFSGTINVNSSSLVAGANSCFPNNCTVNINGGSVDMGANIATIKSLNYAGVQKAPGTYGAIGSGAQHENAQFSGAGILTVTTGATSTTVVTSDVQSTTAGQTVTFTVTVTGNGGDATTPTGTATLYDNGVSIATVSLTGSGNVASGTFATSTLTVGSHPMTATWPGNDSYGTSTSATYNEFIVQPPVITSPATSSTVIADAGTNVNLAITLQDSNGATYQWRKGAVNLSNGANDNAATVAGSTSATLTLISVKAADAAGGNYTCVAHNAAGDATSAAFTLVVNDPAISVQPTNSTFECGSNGCLSVTAAGTTNANGVLLYQWYSPDPSGTAIANATNSTLCFSTVHFTDAGSYSVVISNAFGNSITSQVAVVTVQDTTGPVITLNGAASVTVECHGSFSDPGATATDACQGVSTIASATGGSLDLNTVGDYTLSYTASDSFSNPGNVVTRVVHVRDTTAPSVTLTGAASINVECHGTFSDPGASAADTCDAAPVVSTSGVVNANTVGTYTVTYTATDASGNHGSATRQVVVIDTTAPVVTLNGNASVTVECHGSFSEPGASAADTCAGSLGVSTSGTLDLNTVGTYTRTYSATDPAGNSGTTTRIVHVSDSTAPSLVGVPADTTAECDSIPAAGTVTATDICDANPNVGLIESTNAGSCAQSYTLVRTWTATDAGGNTATAAQHITVRDTTAPIVTLLGGVSMNVECHTSFVDPNATATDACAGNVSVSPSGTVDTNTVGDYTMTYSATDPCGNTGTATRVVHVVDNTPPIVTLNGTNDSICAFEIYPDPGATANDTCSGSLSVSTSGTVNTDAVGDYTLTYTAQDAAGNSSSVTRVVSVSECGTPITITGQPQNQLKQPQGTNVTLSVMASGSPLRFQWYENNVLIPGATGATNSFAAHTNAITGTNLTYYVVVSNAVTSVQSSSALVTVLIDKTKPALIVTAPRNNTRAQSFTVKGKTTDTHGNDAKLKYFWTGITTPGTSPTYSIDISGVGIDPTKRDFTGSGFALTNPPSAGTNTLTIWVEDLAGNASSPAKVVKVFWQVPHTYALTISGDGTGSVKVSTKGAPQEVVAGAPTGTLVGSANTVYNMSLYAHQVYSIKYTPDPKLDHPTAGTSIASVVSNAVPVELAGTTTTRAQTVTFTAGDTDTSANVSFARNRFVDMAGTYNGVFTGLTNVASSRLFVMTISPTRTVSGYLMDATKTKTTFTAHQTLNADGSGTIVAGGITISGSLAWTGSEDPNGVKEFIGSATDGSWTAALTAEKADKTALPTEGFATMQIPGGFGGSGFATVHSKNGTITAIYTLADDDKHAVSFAMMGNRSKNIPQWITSTHSGGLLFGNLIVDDGLTNLSAPALSWIRPSGNLFYPALLPAGFTNSPFAAVCSPFLAGSKLNGTYTLNITGGGLANDITSQTVTFTDSKMTAAGKVKVGLMDPFGKLKFTFQDGTTPTHTTIAVGALLQNATNGVGFFIKPLGTDAGNVSLTPQ